jgi:tetratricopeptide (TPR) repeat protein
LLELHTFARGELVSNRLRLVRFIGEGGMGEVYEAEDLELRRKIALKTIRPEIAADERVIARFKQEIQLSLNVTHPNVCRIYDTGRHKPAAAPSEPRGQVIYLTMELLPGKTLAERLRQTGRMTTGEALPILSQIIDGMDAAHRAGIVHGDLKSSNVMLVPSDTGSVRAVVTDFGLARLASSPAEAGPTGGTGTPAYMAPEQVERGSITKGSDIYSFGVVMFEMVTGALPFLGDTPTLVAKKRLVEDAPPPRSFVPDLDRRWERAILRCLERDPANRFATMADVAVFLHRTPWSSVLLSRRASIFRAAVVASLFVLTALGFRAYLTSRPEHKAQLARSRIREGLAYQKKGQPEQASAAFEQARDLYVAAGDRAGVAEALTKAGDLLQLQGDLVQAKSAYASALAISREIGADQSVATLLRDTGNILHVEGDIAGARSSYASALTIFSKINDQRGVAVVFKDMGNVAPDEGEAQRDWERALSISKKIGDRPGAARALDDIGALLDAQGYLVGARKAFEEELSLSREMGGEGPVYKGPGLGNLGDVLYEQGNLAEAAAQFDEALRIGRQFHRTDLPWLLCDAGELLFQQDQLRDARNDFEEALALGYKFDDKTSVGNARLHLAKLSLEEARPAEAETQARQAEEQFRLQKDSDGTTKALTLLAQAFVAEGKFREMKEIRTQLLPAIKHLQAYGDRLSLRMAVANLPALTGNAADRTRYLESALNDASRRGYLGYELEARLGLGEIAMRSGHTAEGRVQLVSLAKEAQAKGFALIGRHAHEALSNTE